MGNQMINLSHLPILSTKTNWLIKFKSFNQVPIQLFIKNPTTSLNPKLQNNRSLKLKNLSLTPNSKITSTSKESTSSKTKWKTLSKNTKQPAINSFFQSIKLSCSFSQLPTRNSAHSILYLPTVNKSIKYFLNTNPKTKSPVKNLPVIKSSSWILSLKSKKWSIWNATPKKKLKFTITP